MPARASKRKRAARPVGSPRPARSAAVPLIVFIDRDGVLNRDPAKTYYVRKPGEFRWIPGVFTALRPLAEAGAAMIVISNQAGVGKGLVAPEALDAVTDKMFGGLASQGIVLRGVFYCTHTPEAGCGCRKPKTGLFKAADRSLGLKGSRRFMIGDTERDMTAGRAAGCRTVLVLSGKTRSAAQAAKFKTRPDHTVNNLKKAVQWILAQKRS